MGIMKHIAGALLILAALASNGWGRGIPIDSYAAMVNNRVITAGDVYAIFQPIEQQLRDTYEGDELEKKLDEAYRNALNALIDKALILEEFASQGGTLSDRAIEDYVNNIIHERFNNDRMAFFNALAEERMTLEDWKAEMKDRLIVTLMRRKEINDRVVITPGQVRAVYDAQIEKYRVPEQVKMRMIVIHQGTADGDREAKRAQTEQILARLKQGEDFATVAKEVSEGAKAAQGGDMGWIDPASLRPELAQAAKALPPSQISDIIEAGKEYYIIQIEGRKNTTVKSFDEVRAAIEEDLKKEKSDQLYDAWTARLRKKFYVKVYEPPS
jgi:peptidyl-prolyl cis-trans isomerase SurA